MDITVLDYRQETVPSPSIAPALSFIFLLSYIISLLDVKPKYL
jgi:hypothetical protein